MSVAAATVPTGVVVFNVVLDAAITFGGGGSFTFFGVSVAESYLKQGTLLTATYNGASYAVSIQPSFSQSGFIQGSDIADTTIALTKLVALPSAQIIVGNGSNVPTAVTMSGDATISNAGALTIANSAVTAAKIASDAVTTAKILDANVTLAKLEASLQAFFSNSATEYYQELAIPAASVLTLFATPVTIVAAQGSGKKIIVKRATLEVDFNTTAYTTNGTLELACSGAGAAQATSTANNGLFASVSRESNIAINSAAGVGDSVIIANTALVVRVASANPAAGNSDITVRVWYSIEQ
jgi:hypothetical protein